MKCSKCNNELNGSLVCKVCGQFNLLEFTDEKGKNNLVNKVETNNDEYPIVEESISKENEDLEEIEDNKEEYSTVEESISKENKDLEETIDNKEEYSIVEDNISKENNDLENITDNKESIENNVQNEIKPLPSEPKKSSENKKSTFLKSSHFLKNRYNEIRHNDEKLHKVTVILLILSIVFISFITIYTEFFSPKVVYKKSVKEVIDLVNNNLLENYNTISGNIDGDIVITEAGKTNTNFTFGLGYGIDYKQKIASFDVLSNYNNKLVDGNYYLANGNLYRHLSNVDINYSYQQIDEFERLFNNDTDSIIRLNNSISRAFKKSIKNKFISKETTSLTINNKKINKKALVLKDKRFIIKFLTNLKKDDDFVNNYSKINNIETNLLIKNLEDEINNIKSSNEEEYFIFDIYLQNMFNEVIGFKLGYKNSVIEIIKLENNKYNFSYKNALTSYNGDFKYKKENNYFSLSSNINEKNKEIKFNIKIKTLKNKVIPAKAITIDNNVDIINNLKSDFTN